MKTFIVSASVLASVAPFLASADVCGKPESANGPGEFGQR
jgi:hypothetical protein